MKTLSMGLLGLALLLGASQSLQAEPAGRAPLGATARETRANDGVHKRRYYGYYGRPYVRPYVNYRPYIGGYYYRPYARPYYYGPAGYYFGTGAYRYYPQPYYGNIYYY